MPNTFLVELFQHKAWCNRRLVEALRAAPADADRRQMAVILLTFEHTSIVDRIFRTHLGGPEHDLTAVVSGRVPDMEALAATLHETDTWYVDYAGRVTPAELETVVEFDYVGDDDQGSMTKGQMLAHIITHGASHRGAIGKMLEGLGVRGAPDMVTTFHQLSRIGA